MEGRNEGKQKSKVGKRGIFLKRRIEKVRWENSMKGFVGIP
jgi:hypothetical protein